MAITVERDGGTAIVTIDRPEAMNALDLEHAESLRETLGELPRGRFRPGRRPHRGG